MDFEKLGRNWDELGNDDPLWAILSSPEKRNRKWAYDEFFQTGTEEIQDVMHYMESLALDVHRRRALDFGCGVGRLTQALCKYFARCDGVDIASSMIELANRFNRFGNRCHYHLNNSENLNIFADDTFDFIYSCRVLQHMKPEFSERYIREFIRVLAPEGVLIFQVPSDTIKTAGSGDDTDHTICNPLPESAFRAHITPVSPISVLEVATVFSIRVTIKNTSDSVWPGGEGSINRCPMQLGNHWLDTDENELVLDDGRAAISVEVQPSDEIDLELTATTPAVPGFYLVELDLVQENVAWFKDKGSATTKFPMQVVAAAAPHGEVNDDPPLGSQGGVENRTDVLIPRIEMHGLNRQLVVQLIQDTGGSVIDVREDQLAGPFWKSFTYCIAKVRPEPRQRSNSRNGNVRRLGGEEREFEQEEGEEPRAQDPENIDIVDADSDTQITGTDLGDDSAPQPATAVDTAAVRTMHPATSDALHFLESAIFPWHQRFQLAPGVHTPGAHDIEWLLQRCNVQDVSGLSVLDIGTNNGAVCFEMERRGAARVIGVDLVPADFFGFQSTRDFLGSRAEYVQCSVYDLPNVVHDRFDLVFFLGVLYHLRHPLLALDCVRTLTGGTAFIETAVADHELSTASHVPVARFYRRAELGNDSSNWFAPTTTCLVDWCWSCGLEPREVCAWPEEAPQRCLMKVVPDSGGPEYRVLSNERPVRVVVE